MLRKPTDPYFITADSAVCSVADSIRQSIPTSKDTSQAVCGKYAWRRLDDRLGLLAAEFLNAWRSKG
jgi:hypothetical protein